MALNICYLMIHPSDNCHSLDVLSSPGQCFKLSSRRCVSIGGNIDYTIVSYYAYFFLNYLPAQVRHYDVFRWIIKLLLYLNLTLLLPLIRML